MITTCFTGGIHFETVDLAETFKLTKCVTATVRKTIFKTVLAAGGKSVAFAPVSDPPGLLAARPSSGSSPAAKLSVTLQSYRVLSSKLGVEEWKSNDAVEVKVFQNRRVVKSLEQLHKPLQIGVLAVLCPKSKTDKTKEIYDVHA